MTRKAYIADEIGGRIRKLRLERGWTQAELAERIGTTQRSIVHYETHGKYPPAPILAAMAGAFNMTIDALMAPDDPKLKLKHDEPDLFGNPEERRLWIQFRKLQRLPERDQRAIVRMLNSMETRQHA